jgi:hypothetical protein
MITLSSTLEDPVIRASLPEFYYAVQNREQNGTYNAILSPAMLHLLYLDKT